MDHSELEARVLLYAQRRQLAILTEPLGGGTDGTVWKTADKTAVKILRKREVYATEKECYLRFLRANTSQICGFVVPQLVDYADDLLAIEMTIVEPPRILDFGKVALDHAGDFSEQTMTDWYAMQEELWGSYWPQVRRLLVSLRAMGIYYADPNPYNITPENYDPDL